MPRFDGVADGLQLHHLLVAFRFHALLLVSADPLTQDDIMEELNISRGNVNMNIRELISWGLVERVILTGERKEFFSAEKDIWKVVKMIVKERKIRSYNLLLTLLEVSRNWVGRQI